MSLEDIKSPLPPRNMVSQAVDDTNTLGQVNMSTQPVYNEPVSRTESMAGSPTKEEEGGTKKFKPIKLLIGLILLVGVIAGGYFFINKNGIGKEVVINYWGLWENEAVMGGLVADFEAKNPGIKINYKNNQKIDYRTRLKGRLQKDPEQEEVPDIFRIHSSWVPMFEDDLARVPDSVSKSVQLEEDFWDVYKADLKIRGEFVGIPLMYDGLVMFYNKDLIESAGVKIPQSWWDLKEAAEKLTVKDEAGNIKVAGVALGTIDNVDHWSDVVGLMMKQNGVNPIIDSPDNDTKIKDVLAFYSIFRKNSGVWDERLPSSTQFFASGKLGFYFGPSWRVFNIMEINPNLRFEISKMPQLPVLGDTGGSEDSGLTNINWSSYWFEGVSSRSKHQKEAWKFLEYLASKEGLEKFYTAASQVRSFGEIYPRKSMADSLRANKMLLPFLESANSASGWYLSDSTHDDGVNDEMKRYFGNAINGIVLDNKDPESVLPELRLGINQLVVKYKLR